MGKTERSELEKLVRSCVSHAEVAAGTDPNSERTRVRVLALLWAAHDELTAQPNGAWPSGHCSSNG